MVRFGVRAQAALPRARWAATAAVVLLALVALWAVAHGPLRTVLVRLEPRLVGRTAPTWSLDLPLTEKPSLVVLPFENRNGRHGQDWVADGFTETLISSLSRLRNLYVIAPGSAFQFKGRVVDVRELGAILRVEYVLRGSVQQDRDRLRINAHLVDARSGRHLWAGRYDVPGDDLFHVQDRLTQSIAEVMRVKLLDGELARLRRRRMTNLRAFKALQEAKGGWYANHGGGTCERYAQASRLYRRAVRLAPRYSSAWVGLAWHRLRAVSFACGDERAVALRAGIKAAQHAVALDPDDAEGFAVLAVARLFSRDDAAFRRNAVRAVELGGGNAGVLANVAWGDVYVGRYAEAQRLIRLAIRLHPYYPAWYLNVLAIASLWQGHLDDARQALRISLARNGQQVCAQVYAVVLDQRAGHPAAASTAAHRLLRAHAGFTVKHWLRDSQPYRPAEAARLRGWLVASGLPPGT